MRRNQHIRKIAFKIINAYSIVTFGPVKVDIPNPTKHIVSKAFDLFEIV